MGSVRFGCIKDLETFNDHGSIQLLNIKFDEQRQQIEFHVYQNLIILEKNIIESSFIESERKDIVLLLKKPLICYRFGRNKRVRHRTFELSDEINNSVLGNTSAIYLEYQPLSTKLRQLLISKFHLIRTKQIRTIKVSVADNNNQHLLLGVHDFLSNYAWDMLLSLGFRIKDKVNRGLLHKVRSLAESSKDKEYENHVFYRKVLAVYNRAKNDHFFDINENFDRIEPQWLPMMKNAYVYIPRVYWTPYALYPRPIKPSRSNRVVRHADFGVPTKHYCRVLLKDCNFNNMEHGAFIEFKNSVRRTLISRGLVIGQEKFEFLLFSNSQLRDKSFYFYRCFKRIQVADIYRWLGNFNHEKCIGTQLARMAQCFTSTSKGIRLSREQLIEIPDIFDKSGRCFTDGCGLISTSLLRKVCAKQAMSDGNMPEIPSVIQVRCGGLKGVLVHDPHMHDDCIFYTKSQKKFDSNHLELELIKIAASKPPNFNRQVITLLENCGVRTVYFTELQNKFRMKLSFALICNEQATKLFIHHHIMHYDWHRMKNSGIDITREPFFHSLLMTVVRDRIKNLREKTHIPLPKGMGATLLGAADFRGLLQDGEIFVRLSTENNSEHFRDGVLIESKVIITRMPCHHPGDIRILKAVDIPQLHHLKDCVIFPTIGQRPHPTEMSGGDLDGDEYWLCWDPCLTQQITKIHEPGDYLAPEKQKHENITNEMRITHLLDILENSSNVGILSRRHLAICHKESPNHPKALELAEYISDALDYPKTGVMKMTEAKFKELDVNEYPEFMMNPMKKEFCSNKILSHLFRDIDQVAREHEQICDQQGQIKIDTDYLIDGFNSHIKKAERNYNIYVQRMESLLQLYELNSEEELITGCHFTRPDESRNNDDFETATLEFKEIQRMTRAEFNKIVDNSYRRNNDRNLICYQLAAAYYWVAYQKNEETNNPNVLGRKRFLSFAWIGHDYLAEIKQQRQVTIETAEEKLGKYLMAVENWTCSNTLIMALNSASDIDKSIDRAAAVSYLQSIDRETAYQDIIGSILTGAGAIGQKMIQIIKQLNKSRDTKLQPVASCLLIILHRISTQL